VAYLHLLDHLADLAEQSVGMLSEILTREINELAADMRSDEKVQVMQAIASKPVDKSADLRSYALRSAALAERRVFLVSMEHFAAAVASTCSLEAMSATAEDVRNIVASFG
jgi:hypothetical protein